MDASDLGLDTWPEPARLLQRLRKSGFVLALLLATSQGTPATEGLGIAEAVWTDTESPSTFEVHASALTILGRASHELDVARRLLSSSATVLSDPAFQGYLSALECVLSRHRDGPQSVEEAGELAGALASARAPLDADVVTLAAWVALRRAIAPERDYDLVPRRFLGGAESITRIAAPTAEEFEDWLAFQSLHDV